MSRLLQLVMRHRPDNQWRSRARRGAGWLISLWVAVQFAVGAEAPGEYQVKATYLYNFVRFVEWPAAAFASADTPITIGVLGDDPFGTVLDQTVKGETVRNRKLAIQRSRRAPDLKDCHVVFISRSEKGRLADVLASLDAGSTLTVGETDNFTHRGGAINLYLDGNKVRFEINAGVTERKGLKLSSQLLKLGAPAAGGGRK